MDRGKIREWQDNSEIDVCDGKKISRATNVTNIRSISNKETDAIINQEFLAIHHQYGHISFKRLIDMAKVGIIPSKFAKCRVPRYLACMYAKAIKRKWRDKPRKDYVPPVTKRSGQCVLVDQLVSHTPGLVAQISGILTTKRYKYVTVFVDEYSKIGYTYLQTGATADETILAKRAFEAFSRNHGVTIESYNADNGIFRSNKWVQACRQDNQPLSFAGVNAHHQNGLAERRIRSLQDMTRAMLIHASTLWPKNVDTFLWPYAMRMACDAMNETPLPSHPSKWTPTQIFSATATQHNRKHFHPFGCPVHVLDSALQAGKPHHKWSKRSRVGIYLGRSPLHARNVALVLDRQKGFVSPQFHVQFDPQFDTVKHQTS